MKVTTITAKDMREALKEVRDLLGPDAVILSTRSVREKGAGGLGTGQTLIELKACPGPSQGGGEVKGERLGAGLDEDPVVEPPRLARLAPPEEVSPRVSRYGQPAEAAPPPTRPVGAEGLAARFKALQEEARQVGRTGAATAAAAAGGMQTRELTEIRRSLAKLEERVSSMPSAVSCDVPGLDAEGKRRYSTLLMHGVEEPIARKLAMVDKADKERGLEVALKRFLEFRDPMAGQARVIALVGPTGVGKTTTLAKIAADLLLNRRRSVGMITLDTFRVGAVAQLETYARLLQVRLVVARSLSEVKAGLHSLNRCDFILVDTVGSSPYNRRQVNSTGSLLPVMGEDREVLLCMAANVRETEQQAVFRRFSTLQPTGLIFTKLDETVTYGGILNVALRARLPLTLFTDGQRVPENLGWVSAATMAKWFEQPDTTGKE
ncbi:MAG: flagellar biosynthesis protein FlhF [Magnetococcales bacterium]|nr:flagellar biosynthesis protein FlhF [Magnetococcales bacterium]